jgi:3-mercaptopyruvate sulfurtransferase SseA
MNKMIRVQRGRRGLVGLVAATTIVLAGCSGTEDAMQGAYPKAVAASLATVSADNYDDNEYGLITGSTLTGWIDDWAANKPANINGELIILQVSDGALTDTVDASCVDGSDADTVGTCKYFKPATGVRSYSLGSSTWVETRDNGVTETVSVVLSGEKMDALLAAYDIDPTSDMIVFAMGSGGKFQNMLMGRAHYLFRYWGAEAEHLAMLNGGATHASVIPNGERGTYLGESNSGVAPTGGTISVKELYADNTVLQATLGDMMAVARGDITDTFVWDARSAGEWSGNLYSTGATTSIEDVHDRDSDGVLDVDDDDNDGDTIEPEIVSRVTAMNGTVKGAKNLSYENLLVLDDATEDLNDSADVTSADASYRYLDKATLATKVSDLGYTAGKTVYTYCRTTYRAMITGTATGVILGYPTRYYDGAMIEWLQMANIANHEGGLNLPATSPWQTAALTDNLSYNDDYESFYIDVPVITDAYASSTDKVVEADRVYKTGTVVVDSSGSSGGAPVPNGCG